MDATAGLARTLDQMMQLQIRLPQQQVTVPKQQQRPPQMMKPWMLCVSISVLDSQSEMIRKHVWSFLLQETHVSLERRHDIYHFPPF